MTNLLRPVLGATVVLLLLAGCAASTSPAGGSGSTPGSSPAASPTAASTGPATISSLADIGGTAWQSTRDPVNDDGWLFNKDGTVSSLQPGRAEGHHGALPTDTWAVTGNTLTFAFTLHADSLGSAVTGKGDWDAGTKTLTIVITDAANRVLDPIAYQQVEQVFP